MFLFFLTCFFLISETDNFLSKIPECLQELLIASDLQEKYLGNRY